jgi:putative NADPH-quinone reductase
MSKRIVIIDGHPDRSEQHLCHALAEAYARGATAGFSRADFRPGFAYALADPSKGKWTKRLKGKSARIVVTMGMPALAYRWMFGAHSLKSLERNILGFVGIGPIKETLVGMVEVASQETCQKWLAEMERLGRSGA